MTRIGRRTPLLTAAVGVGLTALLLGLPALAQTAETSTDAGADDSVIELSIVAAIILGLVEGITEFLPVSSTGHLLVTNNILNLGGTPASDAALDTYAICIQAGAILAVLVVYQERVRQMIDGLLGRSEEGRRVLIAIIVAFIPTAIIARLVFDAVREQLFGALPIAVAWLVGGLGIIGLHRQGYFDRAGRELANISMQQAFLIGLMQTLAVWPGTSRSLVTIIAGILVGLNLRAAVEFSFLLGLITLTAATAFAGLQDGSGLVEQFGWVNPLIGLVVAFVSAVAAVRWMVAWLNDRGFEVFGWYRIAIGIIALGAIGLGWL